jgi:hypothetical protein
MSIQRETRTFRRTRSFAVRASGVTLLLFPMLAACSQAPSPTSSRWPLRWRRSGRATSTSTRFARSRSSTRTWWQARAARTPATELGAFGQGMGESAPNDEAHRGIEQCVDQLASDRCGVSAQGLQRLLMVLVVRQQQDGARHNRSARIELFQGERQLLSLREKARRAPLRAELRGSSALRVLCRAAPPPLLAVPRSRRSAA